MPAGKLVDECGCKGWQQGGAAVSDVHANFIINTGGATCLDVCRLIARVRHRVWQQQSVNLQLEVQCWHTPAWLHAHARELTPAIWSQS